MLTYVIRRLLLLIPTLLGMTLLVFSVMAMAPGGIGGPNLTERGGQVTGASAQRLRDYYNQRYGLDKPFIIQYGRWLNQILPVGFATYGIDDPAVIEAKARAATLPPGPDGQPAKPSIRPGDLKLTSLTVKWPDLGESLVSRRPVVEVLAEALPVTLGLNILSIPIVYATGVILGIIAARNRGNSIDIGLGSTQLGLWSVPSIWAGVLLIGFLANSQYIRLFPTGGISSVQGLQMPFLPTFEDGQFVRGFLLDRLWHLALPVLCLSYGGTAFLSKLTRGSVLENMNSDYVRTARGKGLSERIILFRHVFRNSLLALITVAAGILPALLGGAIVVESIFGIPGMGKLGVDAINQRDREMVLAVTLVGGFIGLTSMLVRDLLYAVADPRVTYN